MGSFTLLTSALITGGVGPWLPYQMFTAGWTGMTAGWLGNLVRPWLEAHARRGLRSEMVLLCGLGFVWGILYGAIINIYFWPFAVGAEEQAWVPGLGVDDVLARYAAFYATTSLGWDLARAVGNSALLLLLGAPTVRALDRFRRRFHFEVRANA
jgi:energy-coupling factor transport system substrate-specific component